MGRDDRKAELKQRLIEAAEAEILEHGLAGLKARAVTARAGCALGALYTAVEDLDGLVVEVNSRTLNQLGGVLRAAVAISGKDPCEALQALASTYADFAISNRHLWLSLFEFRPSSGRETPDWHRDEHAVLLKVILPGIRQLRPDLGPEALAIRARTIFAAVHGVIHLALQGQFVGVPMAHLKSEIRDLVDTLVAGARSFSNEAT